MGLYSIKDAHGTQDRTNFPQSSFSPCCERQLVPVTTFLSLFKMSYFEWWIKEEWLARCLKMSLKIDILLKYSIKAFKSSFCKIYMPIFIIVNIHWFDQWMLESWTISSLGLLFFFKTYCFWMLILIIRQIKHIICV